MSSLARGRRKAWRTVPLCVSVFLYNCAVAANMESFRVRLFLKSAKNQQRARFLYATVFGCTAGPVRLGEAVTGICTVVVTGTCHTERVAKRRGRKRTGVSAQTSATKRSSLKVQRIDLRMPAQCQSTEGRKVLAVCLSQ